VEITEAKIKLMPSRSDRLQAFCTITIDNDFVIRDIKIIEGAKGAFVAMPSRKLTDKCPKCGGKNHLRARHCNECGAKLDENRATKDKRGRAKLHADIAHPINSACRERIQSKIIEAYQEEVARSKEPGYVPAQFEEDEEEEFEETAAPASVAEEPDEPPQTPPPAEHLQAQADEEARKELEEINKELEELKKEQQAEESKKEDDFTSGIL